MLTHYLSINMEVLMGVLSVYFYCCVQSYKCTQSWVRSHMSSYK